ncbi:hypothetical protein D0T51_10840 [Parabacteroides sp. 52]|uniref:phosphoethanolamine transferase n=1 Tax=unclassified Parabacteroides TaxID=2649774 RepID=UPI0013D6EF20|nr:MULTISPECIES: phosphoethanolamine transferase [unclassified Parabacteroides]MDH6535182.1 glucan phosphoethanolaminetransferase (alkaline phosphatase superfamily) [Parabacteroides sp. PM5-20]NDV56221.1 hypothetical protein [Parabacteroides sp. 52]
MNFLQKINGRLLLPPMYGWVLFLFILLWIPNFTAVLLLSDLQGSIGMKVAYLGFSLIVWLLPALFLRLRVYFGVMSVFLLLAPIEISHIILNKMPVTEGFLSAILHTNAAEAWELLGAMKAAGALILLLWFVYFFILLRKIKNTYLFTRSVRIWILFLFLAGNLLLLGAMFFLAYKNKAPVPVAYATHNFAKKYRKIYPCDLLTVAYRTYEKEKEGDRLSEDLAHFSFHASRKETVAEKEIYVVIIGESARYGNLSLNGYMRPTTPELEKIEGLLSYSDVFASANLTEIALPLLLTRATALDPATGYQEKTFIDAFAECGFHTAWIGSQSSQYTVVKRVAKEVDFHYFSTTDFDASTNYDEKLLPYIDKVLEQDQKKQLIVIQTLGSHFRYNFRYPESYAYFTPSLEGTVGYSVLSPANKEVLVNTYDNTIRYTDYIISSIIHRVKKQEAVSSVFYISDHAENLFDDENNLILHGGGEFSTYETHIPLLLWTSEKYEKQFPEKREFLSKHRDKKISTVNVFHSILDIANISYPGESLDKSIASSSFSEDSIRYVLMPDKSVIQLKKERR